MKFMYHVPLWMGCTAFILTFACAIGAVCSRFSSKPIFFRLVFCTGPAGLILAVLNLLICTGHLTDSLAEGIAKIGLCVSVGTAGLYCLCTAISNWIFCEPCKSERKEKNPVFLYGEPKTGRINPSELQEPAPCSLCSCTLDSGAQLRMELRKDGYGECSFCPRCGRELKEG